MGEYPDENYMAKLNAYLERLSWLKYQTFIPLNVWIGNTQEYASWWCAGGAYPMGGCNSLIQVNKQIVGFQWYGGWRKFWFGDTRRSHMGYSEGAIRTTHVANMVVGQLIDLLNRRKKFDPRTMKFVFPETLFTVEQTQ